MNKILGLGKYLFAAPMAIFGVMHFLSADIMGSKTPGGNTVVYITGIALIAAAVSIFIEKYDKLAATLLGLLLLLFIIPHAQNIANNDLELINILKNISLAGGAFMYTSIAKDSTYVK